MAADGARDPDYSVFLSGDLSQMANQERFLVEHGIDVSHNNVYPCLKPCDKERAFKLIWKHKCDGWWHYSSQYAKLGICSEDEFKETLSKWCEDRE